jgi:O-antigen ligase
MEPNYESTEQTERTKQRHGCVTAWLIFIIVANSFTALIYLFAGDYISDNTPGGIPNHFIYILAFLGLGNVICASFLLKWKKLGFWGFLLTSVCALVINIYLGLGVGQSTIGLLGFAILFGVLQIKQNDISAWNNME